MITAVGWQLPTAIAVSSTVYWLLPKNLRWPFLSAAGITGLAVVAPASAGFLILVTITSYTLLVLSASYGFVLAYSVAVFVAMLVLRGSEGGWIWLGASFYVLRAIHVVTEHMRSPGPPPPLLDFVSYMMFPPTLSIGPVERLDWFLREKERSRWSPSMFSAGLETLLYGYAQIVLLADYAVAWKFNRYVAGVQPGILRDWMECVGYGGFLYLKLSGYSDVAIGFALLVGIRIRENFNRPYLAINIADFWRRWHISVTGWCRDYVNRPVLSLTRSRGAAVVSAMLVLGLWHEFSLRYMLWGAYQGLGFLVWIGFKKLAQNSLAGSWVPQSLGTGTARCLTMAFVISGFAITKEPNANASLHALALLIGIRAW